MSHATSTAQPSSAQSTVARGTGLLVAMLAAVVAVCLTLPGSWSDTYVRDDTMRTVYPLMLIPAIAIAFVAGITAACRPATARVAAVISTIMSIQVAGIAVVASRDWLNFAGAGFASWERGFVGSRLAATMAVVAGAVILASIALYWRSTAPRQAPAVQASWVLAGAVVAIAVPLLLCSVLDQPTLTAAGQFVLWWSLPWGLGLVAAGILHTAAARRAALLCVAASMILTLVCVGASPLYCFGLSLPG
jgi:hypothetical protein